MRRECGYQYEAGYSTGVTVGKRLGDSPTHRVTHNINCSDAKSIKNSGDFIGNILDLISMCCLRGHSVIAMVDHDHPSIGGQLRADLIPLSNRGASQTMDQKDRIAMV